MQDDLTEQPLTEHLVDQFAAYFLLTMIGFHVYKLVRQNYSKSKEV